MLSIRLGYLADKGMLKLVVQTLVLLALLRVDAVAVAQHRKYTLNNFSINDGLSQNTVLSVFKDRRGFVWIGTYDGLNRYDGLDVTTFKATVDDDNNLLNATIYCIDEDTKRDRLYVGTGGGGLSVYDPVRESFTNFTQTRDSNSILSNYINDLKIDRDGMVWIANTKGVSVFDPDKQVFNNYYINKVKDGQDENVFPLHLYLSSTNDVWVGTFGHGLIKIDKNGSKHQFFTNTGLGIACQESNTINSIIEYSPGILLVGTGKGCFFFDCVSGKYTKGPGDELEITGIAKGICNDYWIGTLENGLMHLLEDRKVEWMQHNAFDPYALPGNHITSVNVNNGIMWLGTKVNGVCYTLLKPNGFQHYYHVPNTNSLYGKAVFAFENDEKGNVWIGTYEGLSVWNLKDDTFKRIDFVKNGKNVSVWSLKYDQPGILWIGTSYGLMRYDIKRDKTHVYCKNGKDTSLPSNEVYSIERDSLQRLWVGTNYGLCLMDETKGDFKIYKPTNDNRSLSCILIWKIFCDSRGRLWISTEDGLNLYDYATDDFTVFKHDKDNPSSLSSNRISMVCEGTDGQLWVASDMGIDCMDRDYNVILHYGEKSGLSSEYIYTIVQQDNSLWASTNKGINRIDLHSNKISSFDFNDGVQGNEFNPTFARLNDGRILMGGINGFNIFHPDSIKLTSYEPPIYFTGLRLYGKNISIRDTANWDDVTIKKSLITASKILLTHKERFLTLEFAALDYKKPKEIEYYYRMKPISDDWIPLKNQRYLTFIDLQPGNYMLEVKSTNSDGVMCNNVKRLDITVIPPFWKTSWFFALLVAVIFSWVYLLVRYRLRKEKREQVKMAVIIKKRTHEIEIQRNVANKQRDEIARQKNQLEELAMSLETKVKQRTSDLEKAKLAAEESDRLKTAFLSNMSHEIRTPMNAIIGFSELLLDTSLNPQERLEFATMIRSNGDELLNLLNDIIDISMIESGQMTASLSRVSVNEMLNQVYVNFSNSKYLIDKAQLDLKLTCLEQDFEITTDPFRLRQVLNNLVSNALKFTSEGYVILGCEIVDGYASFFVEDTGIGIDELHQQLIFRRFLKVDNDVSNLYRGNGLGLTICKNLVELLGGTIEVSSTSGEGSCFQIQLPLNGKAVSLQI